ncbi:PstS family phosphate ABC transporter substrate-binding protein [Chthonobacter rhizosphaerae]|uniref:PstS family phosphate ABC transporter substrate-binding protein n=1 Tax=Chthonobacter rhizosphaerae TaxID=2735553 RepID=UPI0015EE40CF|nr:substrate-binding domain-containing protein [Chthonobacter rhizosphaerae]
MRLRTIAALAAGLLGSFPAVAAEDPDGARLVSVPEARAYADVIAEGVSADPSTPGSPAPEPVVDTAGAPEAIRRFCAGAGDGAADAALATRTMTPDEQVACRASGVIDVGEARIGRDALVGAVDAASPTMDLTPEDWFRAVGSRTLVDGQLLPNRIVRWSQVRPDLPDREIAVALPPADHGARGVFDQAVLVAGCKASGFFDVYVQAGYDAPRAERACLEIREDGRATVAASTEGVLQAMDRTPGAVGVLSRADLAAATRRLKALPLAGVAADPASIASGAYPLAYPVVLLVKKARLGVAAGLDRLVTNAVSDAVAGEGGRLAAAGLVTLPSADRAAARTALGVDAERLRGPAPSDPSVEAAPGGAVPAGPEIPDGGPVILRPLTDG